ncbi:hypothetical protein UlMin_036713 [Ulmus minor]
MAIALLICLMAAPAVYGEQYTVGDTGGWTNSGGGYTTWATGKTFKVGDTLLFNYGSSHKVDVVDKSGYDNCNSANALESHDDGATTITLAKSGPIYFICPVLNHCSSGGMKLSITVDASTSPTTPPTPAATSPSGSGTTPPSTTSPPPPPSGSGATSVVGDMKVFGLSLVFVALLALLG